MASLAKVKKADLADIFGYSLPTVDAWVKEGCPVEATGGKGKAYEFDTTRVYRWLLGREKRPGRAKEREEQTLVDPETGEVKISKEEADRRKAVADAKKSELDLANKMGLVAPIDMIAKVVGDEIANARARLLAVPTKLRPTIQVCSNGDDKTKRLMGEVEKLVHEALQEIKSYEATDV